MTTADGSPAREPFLRRQRWLIQIAFGLAIAVVVIGSFAGLWIDRMVVREDSSVAVDSALLQQCGVALLRLEDLQIASRSRTPGTFPSANVRVASLVLLNQSLDQLQTMAAGLPRWSSDIVDLKRVITPAPDAPLGSARINAARMGLLKLQEQVQQQLGDRVRAQAQTISFLNGMLALLAIASCASLAAAWIYSSRRLRGEYDTELALDRLRRRHALILNSIGDAICGIDSDGVITFANPAVGKMTGWSSDDLLGRPIVELLHIPSYSSITPTSAVDSSLREGEVHRVSTEVFERPDGACIPVEFISTPTLEDGRLTGVVVAFQDISERLRIERMKGEFMAVVSHELRTPLTSLRGALGLLGSGRMGTIPPPGDRMLTIALDNAERLARLVNDILDLERLNAGRFQIERRLHNLGEVMSRAMDVVQPVADRAQVTLQCQPLDLQLLIDSDRILQTLINLMGNAVKFSPAGSTVTVEAELLASAVQISVRDQGRGIPADKLESVFEKFEQVDASDSREKGGTGLGLPICRGIVQQHGGKIWVESVLGRGSTFRFTLPLARESAQPVPPAESAAAAAGEPVAGNPSASV